MKLLRTLELARYGLEALQSVIRIGERIMIVGTLGGRQVRLGFVRRGGWWIFMGPTRTESNFSFLIVIGSNMSHTGPKWTQLFRSSELLILSNDPTRAHPLNLSVTEQKRLLALARQEGIDALNNPSAAERHILSAASLIEVCVAFWKDGQVRGSMMAGSETLEGAVRKATRRAILLDYRWKPLSLEEFSLVQIEITTFSPVKVNIKAQNQSTIDYTKGYTARYGERLGLYVPEVFNAQRFLDRNSFFRTLVETKGGMSFRDSRRVRIDSFEVCDFIESKSNNKLLEMSASMEQSGIYQSNDIEESMIRSAQAGISWLGSIREEDGNIPPVVHVFGHSLAQFDISRLAFVAYALAEWQQTFLLPIHHDHLLRTIRFVRDNIPHTGALIRQQAYALTYLGHAYVSLNDKAAALALAPEVVRAGRADPSDSMLGLQIISLLRRLEQASGVLFEEASFFERVCKERFAEQKKRPDIDIASWAEAAFAFTFTDPEYADRIVRWLMGHQNYDGSFRQSPANEFAYTRGSAKIFEVLAVHPGYENALGRADAWLRSMQYTTRNTFFIQPHFRRYVIGGIRHDYGNPDAWIDSVGHYVLGAVRYLRGKDVFRYTSDHG